MGHRQEGFHALSCTPSCTIIGSVNAHFGVTVLSLAVLSFYELVEGTHSSCRPEPLNAVDKPNWNISLAVDQHLNLNFRVFCIHVLVTISKRCIGSIGSTHEQKTWQSAGYEHVFVPLSRRVTSWNRHIVSGLSALTRSGCMGIRSSSMLWYRTITTPPPSTSSAVSNMSPVNEHSLSDTFKSLSSPSRLQLLLDFFFGGKYRNSLSSTISLGLIGQGILRVWWTTSFAPCGWQSPYSLGPNIDSTPTGTESLCASEIVVFCGNEKLRWPFNQVVIKGSCNFILYHIHVYHRYARVIVFSHGGKTESIQASQPTHRPDWSHRISPWRHWCVYREYQPLWMLRAEYLINIQNSHCQTNEWWSVLHAKNLVTASFLNCAISQVHVTTRLQWSTQSTWERLHVSIYTWSRRTRYTATDQLPICSARTPAIISSFFACSSRLLVSRRAAKKKRNATYSKNNKRSLE